FGLPYKELEKINPKAVMTSISNFGQTGPYRDYKATEIVSFAMGGRMFLQGLPDREPLKFAGNASQYLTGTKAALATISAVLGVGINGEGQHVDISIFECMVGAVDSLLPNYGYSGDVSSRNRAVGVGGFYRCKDGYVQVLGLRWPRMVKMLGKPELISDPRFTTMAAMRENKVEYEALLSPWLEARTREEATAEAQASGVFVAPVLTIGEAVEHHHHRAREFFVEVTHPKLGKILCPGAPFKMSETPWQVRQAAPLLGEHNVEVYTERLGYTREDLVRLRERGVI
ncbi:MAG: CoA transferase, partial [Candidatus Tectomicrobia bacterium]|nr:CoA transferase [Candidatus Tectomicrobia bacterium]